MQLKLLGLRQEDCLENTVWKERKSSCALHFSQDLVNAHFETVLLRDVVVQEA